MSRNVAFIEELPAVVITNNRVRMVAKSGDETYTRVFDISLWRQFIEGESARLREFDRKARERVVVFPRPKRKKAAADH